MFLLIAGWHTSQVDEFAKWWESNPVDRTALFSAVLVEISASREGREKEGRKMTAGTTCSAFVSLVSRTILFSVCRFLRI